MKNSITVFCKIHQRDSMDFYVKFSNGAPVFLFRTGFFDGAVYTTYQNGVRVEKIRERCYQPRTGKGIDIYAKHLQQTRDHILRNLKYLEKEYGIRIFRTNKNPKSAQKAA